MPKAENSSVLVHYLRPPRAGADFRRPSPPKCRRRPKHAAAARPYKVPPLKLLLTLVMLFSLIIHVNKPNKQFFHLNRALYRPRLVPLPATAFSPDGLGASRGMALARLVTRCSKRRRQPMWETTFPRLTHAGLDKPINEDNILPSMHDPCGDQTIAQFRAH